MRRAATVLAVAAALASGLAACGGGSNASDIDTISTPELTVPKGSSPVTSGTTGTTGTTDTTSSTTTTTSPTTTSTTGGTPATPAPNTGGTNAPDTQQNDQAPPAGSPASKFEQFCKENPGAC